MCTTIKMSQRIQGDNLTMLTKQQMAVGSKMSFRQANLLTVCLALSVVFCLGLFLVGEGASVLGANPVPSDTEALAAEVLSESLANQQQQQRPQEMVAPLRPLKSRFRRQARSNYNTNKLQQLELDEQTTKRQLPELIAQAHQDKSVERALLRMLINASLRSNMDTSTAPQRSTSGGWQPATSDSLASLMDSSSSSELAPSGRSLHGRSDFNAETSPLSGADLSSLIATIEQFSAGQLQPLDQSLIGPQQQYSMMDKREYIKPCSFNAISCVRTPFRKL